MNYVPHRQFAERSQRTLTILIVARVVLQNGKEGLGRVRNISETGLMLETAMPLRVGDDLSVELRSRQVLSGAVVWVQDGRVGVHLHERIDISKIVAALPQAARSLRRFSQPRAPRIAANCHIEAQVDGQRLLAELIDISQGGAKVVLPRLMRREERVVLMVPGLPLKLALVRWTADGETGLSFAEPLHFSTLTEWLAVRQEGDF